MWTTTTTNHAPCFDVVVLIDGSAFDPAFTLANDLGPRQSSGAWSVLGKLLEISRSRFYKAGMS